MRRIQINLSLLRTLCVSKSKWPYPGAEQKPRPSSVKTVVNSVPPLPLRMRSVCEATLTFDSWPYTVRASSVTIHTNTAGYWVTGLERLWHFVLCNSNLYFWTSSMYCQNFNHDWRPCCHMWRRPWPLTWLPVWENYTTDKCLILFDTKQKY